VTVAEAVLQLLMETDVEGLIGAGRERSGERTTWRNGYRDHSLDTRLGAVQLRIPKLRQGSYFPLFLEARKSSENGAAFAFLVEPLEQNDGVAAAAALHAGRSMAELAAALAQTILGRSHAPRDPLHAIHCAVERHERQRSAAAPLSDPNAAQRCALGAGLAARSTNRTPCFHLRGAAFVAPQPQSRIYTS
jgi:hypothetical protein